MTTPMVQPDFFDVHNSAGLRLSTPPLSHREDNTQAANYDFLPPLRGSVMEELLDATLPFSNSEMFTGGIQAPVYSDYSDSLYSAQTIADVSGTYNPMPYGVSFGTDESYGPSFFSDPTQSTDESSNAAHPLRLPLTNSFVQNQGNADGTQFSLNATVATATAPSSSLCLELGSTTSTKSTEHTPYDVATNSNSSPVSAIVSQSSNTTNPTASVSLEHDSTVPAESCQDDSVDSTTSPYETTSDYPLHTEQTHHVPAQHQEKYF
ncbi:hypothetical protein K435DRAFT_853479 [Dendrothele bispora CBS 962.96]|uniref:Uncharacterized protein n=1 Tax=Dendrothele bispora (strain CBS 962.96) TaxID=1314807 RepID=A0A4S8MGY2_DENBC|nr:hypothetical protein K435DRAFT_853479 [Dendrothele bispora CBS 962.96]